MEPKEYYDAEGTKIEGTFVTAAEAEARIAAVKEETGKTVAEKEAEITRLQRVSAEKTDNFTRYNDMTAEQKAAYDANTTELIKRNDKSAEEIAELRGRLETKEKTEKESAKNNALSTFHQGDEATKKAIEENYAVLAGMPETTPEEINARARKAAMLAGISVDSQNPLYTSVNGEAPVYKQKEEFVETPKGEEAASLVRGALGIPTPKK